MTTDLTVSPLPGESGTLFPAPAPAPTTPRKEASIVRVAKFIAGLGEGSQFTMQQIREACPGIEQIDRRMRELRELGWQIDTYKTSDSLAPQELRITKIGEPVWEPGSRRRVGRGISATIRRQVFDRDGHHCVPCGIGAGESYPGQPGLGKARLTIGHYQPKGRAGDPDDIANLRTECAICNESVRDMTPAVVDVSLVRVQMKNLARKDKATLGRWMLQQQRDHTTLEELWMKIRQLPAPIRDELQQELAGYLK